MFIKRGNETTVEEVVKRNTGIDTEVFLSECDRPFLKYLDEAVELTKECIKKGEEVYVIGDYDSDGINASAIMYWALKAYGVDPIVRIPKRFSEGYGLSETIINEINISGAGITTGLIDGLETEHGLIITVDNGISSLNAIRLAKEKGYTVIVTDHHQPYVNQYKEMELPAADIIVDPHVEGESEFRDYCGAGIAYRFALELLPEYNTVPLLALASIATVTDVVPLYGANRTLLKKGLEAVNNKMILPGLNRLIEKLQRSHITEEDYGYLIGPVFNAAERMVDNGAMEVFRLLTCTRADGELMSELAEELVKYNYDRKHTVFEARQRIGQIQDEERPIVVYDPKCSEGIVGLVAANLADTYGCPAIVLTDSVVNNDIIKGSGRSISQVDLKKTLDKVNEFLIKYGGHPGAAGLSMNKDRFDEFKEAFKKACGKLPEAEVNTYYDLELDMTEDISNTIRDIKRFAPYGNRNEPVVFHIRYRLEGSVNYMNKNTMSIYDKKTRMKLLGFGMSERYRELGEPDMIECIGTISENWFNGRLTYQFMIQDMI